MKIVIDTNVFVSSFLNPKGTPRLIIDLWKSGQCNPLPCAEILAEYLEVLSRSVLAGEPELQGTARSLQDHGKGSNSWSSTTTFMPLKPSRPSDKVLECALKARAACIVSGDKGT